MALSKNIQANLKGGSLSLPLSFSTLLLYPYFSYEIEVYLLTEKRFFYVKKKVHRFSIWPQNKGTEMKGSRLIY